MKRSMPIVLVIATLCFQDVWAEPVFVRADERNGHGILRDRGDACFLVTPAHVVDFSDLVEIVGSLRVSTVGRLEEMYYSDLGVVRVERVTGLDCGAPWSWGEGLDARLSQGRPALLRSRQEDGSLRQRQLVIVESDARFLAVRAEHPDDYLFQGLSGSLVQLGGEPAGMLMAVEAATGRGHVLRWDHLALLLTPFFGAPQHPNTGETAVRHRPGSDETFGRAPTPLSRPPLRPTLPRE